MLDNLSDEDAALFRAFAGVRKFDPLGIVVPEHGFLRVVRFWRAFRDFEQGKEQRLRLKEEEVERALANHGDGA